MLLIAIHVLVFVISIRADHNLVQHCGDFKAQQILDIDMLLGKWFATEFIYHDREEIDSNTYHNECPILVLNEIFKDRNNHNYMENENFRETHHQSTDNQEEILNWDELMEPLIKVWKEQRNNGNGKYNRHDQRRTTTTTIRPNEDLDHFKKQTLQRLRMVSNEDGKRLEYFLRYNESRPGYWMSFGSQIDSNHNQHDYTQFIGTIQVLKAIRTQAVLTFCHISQKHQFFTIVVSREPWVNRTDLNHIHHMLERKQLPIRHVRSMCMEYRNSSNSLYSGMMLSLSFITLVLLRYFSINS